MLQPVARTADRGLPRLRRATVRSRAYARGSTRCRLQQRWVTPPTLPPLQHANLPLPDCVRIASVQSVPPASPGTPTLQLLPCAARVAWTRHLPSPAELVTLRACRCAQQSLT